MSDSASKSHGDDLHLPWVFVPHGAPAPTEWMAKHPGWIKIPATMVPRATGNRSPGRRSTSLPPVALGTAAEGLAGLGFLEVAPETMALILGAPEVLVAGAIIAVGTAAYLQTESPETDGISGEPRRTRDTAPTEALTPTRPSAPLPGSVLPAKNEASPEGFTPSPPTPTPPGSIPPASPPTILPGHTAAEQSPIILPKDRNEGLEGGARTNSPRARKAAEAADPAVTNTLKDAEWRAHHLINLAAIKRVPALIKEAVKAGWTTDDPGNVAPLPATSDAQKKLDAMGVSRPIHNSGHEDWNVRVNKDLDSLTATLKNDGFKPGTDAYARAARKGLEKIQDDLRKLLLPSRRLTENNTVDFEDFS
jgi:hypothetical protein